MNNHRNVAGLVAIQLFLRKAAPVHQDHNLLKVCMLTYWSILSQSTPLAPFIRKSGPLLSSHLDIVIRSSSRWSARWSPSCSCPPIYCCLGPPSVLPSNQVQAHCHFSLAMHVLTSVTLVSLRISTLVMRSTRLMPSMARYIGLCATLSLYILAFVSVHVSAP